MNAFHLNRALDYHGTDDENDAATVSISHSCER
jgi:hypothetical protein